MTSVLRHSHARALGAGALTVALLSGGTAGAFAASPSPSPTPTRTMSSPSAGMASITATARPASVKHGHTVLLAGRTKGLKVGSPLIVQQEMNGKWVPLRATGKVKTGSSYAITAKLTRTGTQKLRVASATMAGKVYSPTVTVKVR
ncbi:hypothetical protein [Streptomyces sp. NBC_00557]|jgi:hypothetical protein|uniref:hypothetical protein n=1 Tax=Streptomyces sp. NBC_00557 TaxID=2975776 RepID=UPI002E823619|nr:hypothetical protein [Streptomyces sp. NBC_00557]WUC37080.1 hypothetical protein OG956_24155 [Streptomyces sp. NBC_00557]